jgi:glycosyltransferase involved in cell wall biosynthesis
MLSHRGLEASGVVDRVTDTCYDIVTRGALVYWMNTGMVKSVSRLKMKLLLVTDTYPPDINGVARTLHMWVEALRKRGHKVEVVTTLQGEVGEETGRRVCGSLPLPGYPGLRIGLASTPGMQKIILETGAEVLYVATETPLGIAAIRAARKLGVPVVSGFHTNFQTYLEKYKVPGMETIAKTILRSLHNQTARTLTPSVDTAEVLRSWGIQNVGVLGRGVDTELFDPGKRDEALRKTWGAGPETVVALSVGRLAPEKNLPVTARAFEVMREARPGTVGVFVGDGPSAKSLEAEHPGFIFLGSKVGEDLARHYASADVFVFPSETETYGNVVLEAMASGLAVVAYDYAAPRLLIRDGENGWRVPFGDEEAFLKRSAEICAEFQWAEIRLRARETALEHSWEGVVSQFEGELLSASGKEPGATSEETELSVTV